MRIYTVEFENVTVTTAVDLFELAPVVDKPIWLLQLNLGQHTEVQEAEEEQLRIRVSRGYTTSGSVGAAPTPALMDSADTAAGFTAETNNTTLATGGSPIHLFSDTWNVRTPYEKTWLVYPDADLRPRCDSDDQRIVVRLLAAPADTMDISGTVVVGEF